VAPTKRASGRSDASQVGARSGEARNEANADRIITRYEDDGDRRRCRAHSGTATASPFGT
jgi:hypothetical protein